MNETTAQLLARIDRDVARASRARERHLAEIDPYHVMTYEEQKVSLWRKFSATTIPASGDVLLPKQIVWELLRAGWLLLDAGVRCSHCNKGYAAGRGRRQHLARHRETCRAPKTTTRPNKTTQQEMF